MNRVAAGLVCALALASCGKPESELTSAPPSPATPAEDTSAETLAETSEEPAEELPAAESAKPWLDMTGTSIVGFGILRVVPPPGGCRYRIRYSDRADGYSVTDNTQLFVLPGDAFAERPMAYADQFMVFARSTPADDPGYAYTDDGIVITEEFHVAEETTLLVAYGPWTGPDVGRPPGDDHTFTLGISALDPRGLFEWIESEAGELITTNWTNRPGVARGESAPDPLTGEPVWIEVRPLILYDSSLARASDEPTIAPSHVSDPEQLRATALAAEQAGDTARAADLRERANDLDAVIARSDLRITLMPELAERFRRVPIRWR